jgi:hypothetical protein
MPHIIALALTSANGFQSDPCMAIAPARLCTHVQALRRPLMTQQGSCVCVLMVLRLSPPSPLRPHMLLPWLRGQTLSKVG